jgi:anti-sigma-K factor RskA
MTDRREDVQQLADEYVLGLLDRADHDAVELRLDSDVELRRAVGASRDRFLELDLLAEPADHSTDLWASIDARIEKEPIARPMASAPLHRAAPANDNGPGFWRGAALAAMAACLALALTLGWNLSTQPQPLVIAILVNDAGEALAVVEDFGDTRARVTTLADFDVPADRVMQVWTLPSQEMGPVSLGLLDEKRTAVLDGPDLPTPSSGQLYEITLEQQGGSPTGRPTGPILVKGFARMPR